LRLMSEAEATPLAAASEHLRTSSCHDTALSLVQMRQNGLEGSREPLGSDPTLSYHYARCDL
jgi:hypothetical protein